MAGPRDSFVLSSTSCGATKGWVSAGQVGTDSDLGHAETVDFAAYLALRPAWLDEAACRDHDIGDFFPIQGDVVRRGRALALCASCCVVEECLAVAMDMPGCGFGIWGGTTKAERVELRRERRRQDEAA